MKPRRNLGRKFIIFGSFLGLIGLSSYLVILQPLFYPDGYKDIQSRSRSGINQEEIQPGNMRVWSDPFKPKPESK